jgi:DNA helicase-2/ATP-dependent DNA helicase PcrA
MQIRSPHLDLKHIFISHTGQAMSLIEASNVKPGMQMMTQDGLQKVVVVDHLEKSQEVYDLNITDTHNFFANNICTHNSVYAFRGAQVEHILRFTQGWTNANVYKLEENYRSSAAILRAAQSVIDGSHHKSDKRLVAKLPEGAPVRLLRFENHWDEASFVADRIKQLASSGVQPEEIAVAYRTNAQSQAIEEALTEKGMAYHVVGGVGFTRRVEIQGARAYMALLANPRDRMAFERLSGFPKRGIGPAALEAVISQPGDNIIDQMRLVVAEPPKGVNSRAISGITELVHLFHKAQEIAERVSMGELLNWMVNASGMVSYLKKQGERGRDQLENLDGLIELAERYEGSVADNLIDWVADTALHEQEKDEVPAGVRLMSLHASKGLEFPYFFIVGLEEQLFLRGNVDHRGLDEERRLFYVGMTRAKKELVMTFADRRRLWGRELHTQPLQFLFDLPADVVRQRARTKTTSQPSRPGRPAPSARRKSNNPSENRSRTRERPRGSSSTPPPKPKADTSVSPDQFRAGMRVSHKKFGEGQVVDVTTDLVKVRFSDKVRALQVQYAGLRII